MINDIPRLIRQDNIQYLYNVTDGLENWRNVLTDLDTKVNCCLVGNSITEGMFAGRNDSLDFRNYHKFGYGGRIRDYYHKEYDDTGKGLIPYWFVGFWSYTGTWADTNSVSELTGLGLAGRIRQGRNGATATFNFNGTGLAIYGIKKDTAGTFTVSIDGGEATEYTEQNTTTVPYAVYTISELEQGDHVCTITVTGDEFYLIGGREVKGTTGVIVNTTACGMRDSRHFTSENCQSFIFDNFQPELTIISLLSNDFAHDTYDSYQSNVESIITKAKETGDVLLTSVGVNSPYVFVRDESQQEYINLLLELVDEHNVAFADLYARWGGFDGALASGYLADSVTHPTRPAHLDISYCILGAITSQKVISRVPVGRSAVSRSSVER
jgi:hypothetical protein